MLVSKQSVALSEANFQTEVIQTKLLVLVDCWASWCQPMPYLKPAYSKWTIATTALIKIGHLNIATSAQLAAHYRVRVVPTLLIFHYGEVIDRIIGSMTNQELMQKVDQLLASRSISRSQITCL